jgi:hypothetical protein
VLCEFGLDAEKARAETLRLLGPAPGADLDDEEAPVGATAHSHPAPACPDCNVEMEPGILFEPQGHAVTRWASGRRSRGFWRSVRAQHAVNLTAFRCPRCGYLRLFASAE